MRALLTGGYGCIGSWIASLLHQQGSKVWVYDLKEDLHRLRLLLDDDSLSHIGFIQGDVTDLSGLTRALEEHQITHVVHLAGLQVPVCRADPLLGAKVNVLGTLTVFEAIRDLGDQIQRLVYASSGAVFGPPDDYPTRPIPDEVPLRPRTHYGVFKCCNEGNARIYYQDHGISSVGLRPWTVYGVGRDFGMTSEPTRAMHALALDTHYHISYGGWQDLQLAEDVARIFIRCLEAPFEGARSYNLRGHVVDLQTFHSTLCEVSPKAEELITFGESQIPIAYDLDDSALQRDLGPLPQTSLRDGIAQTIAHFQRLQTEGRLDPIDPNG